MHLHTLFGGIACLAAVIAAAPLESEQHQPRKVYPGSSCHGPTNRHCWTDEFDIETDYEFEIPWTGKTRTYTLELTEVENFSEADGVPKEVAMLINGGFPGPTLEADWGDMFEITVINKLHYNGTSIHWHGIRMLENNINDGVNGVTECPIAPGSQKTYRFLAEQYGTSWYHSHFSTQYANGVVGAIIINGPASLPYDSDLGVLQITDWYYGEAESLMSQIQNATTGGRPPPSDNILFNGKHVNGAGDPNNPGEYAVMNLEPGKRHRLRIINTSVDNAFTVSLVGHDMTVIQSDFVPVWSYTTDSLFMTVGQRYDVTIDATNSPGSYWFNVTMGTTGACGDTLVDKPAMIFRYGGCSQNSLPKSEGVVPADKRCEDTTDLVPVVRREATLEGFEPVDINNIAVQNGQNLTHVFWEVNGSPMNVMWEKPTLEYIDQGEPMEVERNVYAVSDDPEWSVWVVQNNSPIPHPMHLHGHDFLVLGRAPALENPIAAGPAGIRTFTQDDIQGLNLENPTRRDTTQLPGWGWVVVAFKTDNPGAWLFHCHIAWHVAQGFSVQFLERVDEIPDVMDLGELDDVCDAWDAYEPKPPKIDSGLRLF